MTVREMSEHECLDLLAAHHLGHLACVHDNRPYIVPIQYAFDAGKLYSFSMPGKKTTWLDANPNACMQVDDIATQDEWHSVVVDGQFTELPDTPDFHEERIFAWSLLQKHDLWWEPGIYKPSETAASPALSPIFFSISLDNISGRHWMDASPG